MILNVKNAVNLYSQNMILIKKCKDLIKNIILIWKMHFNVIIVRVILIQQQYHIIANVLMGDMIYANNVLKYIFLKYFICLSILIYI